MIDSLFWIRTLVLLTLVYFLHKAHSSYINLDQQNHQLISKVVNNAVDQTPLWFRKFRQDITI